VRIKIPPRPDENILKFIEKNGPKLRVLELWEAEIVRIFRKINEYFYPFHRTRVIHEGAACTLHWNIMNRVSPLELNAVPHSAMHHFFEMHASVIGQPGHRWRKKFDGQISLWDINHYSLGFQMFQDIERICTNPTDEDRKWFPRLPGRNFWDVFRQIITEDDDESFIRTYLSPKLIREYAFYVLRDDPEVDYLEVTDIHNEEGYIHIREKLAERWAYHAQLPNISVANVDIANGCALQLQHVEYGGMGLDGDSVGEVLAHMNENLWRRKISLESVNDQGKRSDLWTIKEGKLNYHEGK